MKILFVYRFLTIGGVETVIRARMQQLAEHGVEAWSWFLRGGPGLRMFSKLGERVLIGDSPSIRSIIRDEGFEAATTFDTPEVIEYFNEISVPIFVEAHSPYSENLTYLKHLDKDSINGVLTPTIHQKNVVQEYVRFNVPITVVPNALGVEYFEEHALFKPKPHRPIIGWVGRLDGLKNWKGFFELGKHLKAELDDFELLLVGDFPARNDGDSLYRVAEKKGVLPILRWFKSLDPRFMPNYFDYLRSSEGVLVSTSKGESFGLSVGEAMARACPVIVPDEPPFTEFVSHLENGLLYPQGNYSQAAKAIKSLIEVPHRREEIGLTARRKILSSYSPAKTSAALKRSINSQRY